MPASPDHSESDETARDQSDSEQVVGGFDGVDGRGGNPRTTGSDQPCGHCGEPLHEHEKDRVTHENGRYSYNYVC